MMRVFWVFIFFLPFQSRLYKFLKPLSLSWIDPGWKFPVYFESHADFFISDFLLLVLLGGCLYLGKFDLLSLWKREQKYLSAFLIVACLSIAMSSYASYIIPYWRWGHLVMGALTVYCLRDWMGPSIQKSFKILATVVVLSAVLECAVALPQYFLQHQLGLKMLGEPTMVSRHQQQAAHFEMPRKAVTSIDYYWNSCYAPSSILRACGTLPHPNVLGGFLVFSLLMTSFLYERSVHRGALGAALIFQIITLFTTYSRAALFACLGGMLFWLAMHFLKEKKISRIWKPLLLGLSLSFLLFFPQMFFRGGVISYNQLTQQSDGMRVSMQNVASLMIHDHPWFGVGFNNYLLSFPSYANSWEVQPIAVHNIYLLIAVETGLIGLGLFLIFCAFILYRGWQLRGSLEGRTLLTIFLTLLAIGAVDYYPIVLQQVRLIFFLTAGLLFSLACGVPKHVPQSPSIITL